MLGLPVAVQEADRDRFDAGVPQRRDGGLERGVIERGQCFAFGTDTLLHVHAMLAGDERRRLGDAVVVDRRPCLTTEFQHVAKAARGHEAGARAAPLDDDVRRDGRSMPEIADPGRLQPEGREHLRESVLDRLGRVGRRRFDLEEPDRAAGLVQKREIRERAANVNPDA